MIEIECDFRSVLSRTLEHVDATSETKAYLSSLFLERMRNASDPISGRSIVVSYFEARLRGDFVSFKNVGDHVTWMATMFPENLSEHYDVSLSVARSSYYSCWRLLHKKWSLYEELGNDLQRIVEESRRGWLRISSGLGPLTDT